MRAFIVATLLMLSFGTGFSQTISYTLSMSKPQDHYYQVEMKLEGFKSAELDVKMPVWAPGSYLVREFAKNVDLVKAYDENGKELPVKKVSKNDWKISKGKAKTVRVNYEVYAFELSVRTSFLDVTHGFVSGSGVFMYVDGFREKSGKVKVIPHKDFHVITTALRKDPDNVSRDDSETFVFDNYDQLVDCPLEIGNQEVFTFNAAGVHHTVAMYNEGNYDVERLKVDMAKVVEAATGVFGQNPNKEYTFIIHNVVDAQGGLEHMNSTVLSVNRWTYAEDYVDFLNLVAHEYFHLWNVKRVRPVELGPFDYDNENYTSLLWVMEGFTSYYEKLILLRAGYYSREQFLAKMFSSVNYVEGSVGSRVQPVAHASFDAWIKAYRPNENSSNTTMTYYSRGSVMAMLIDAMIVKKYKGEKCLDHFMQHLYATYYEGKKRGFSETEFKQELSSFMGESMDDFFARYIDGTEIPDYAAVLAPLGVKVQYVGASKPSIGLTLGESGGKTVVRGVRRGSAAEDAGLSVNDEIIGMNGYRIDKRSLESYFESAQTGDVMNFLFAREDQLFSVELTVTEWEQPKFKYSIDKAGSSEELFNYWLR